MTTRKTIESLLSHIDWDDFQGSEVADSLIKTMGPSDASACEFLLQLIKTDLNLEVRAWALDVIGFTAPQFLMNDARVNIACSDSMLLKWSLKEWKKLLSKR